MCGGAPGWQWSLGPGADGLQEAFLTRTGPEGEEGGRVQDWAQWLAAKREGLSCCSQKKVSQYDGSAFGRRQTCASSDLCVGTPSGLSCTQLCSG